MSITASPAPAIGERRGRVAFVVGCIQEAFLAPVNQATRRVLRRNGFEIVTPMTQTCCGAAHAHVGELDAARALARRNIDAFLAEDMTAIIVNAGGCGLALKEYPHLLKDDPIYAERARRFASLVRDVNEFLADHLHRPPRGEMRVRATYVDSCHLRHGQRITRQPRDLLRAVPGLELIELRQPDRCCGSAGVYNIAQPDIADQVLDAKMKDVAATGATLVVTTNTGCHLQLIAGVRKARLNAKVMHVVEVLDEVLPARADPARALEQFFWSWNRPGLSDDRARAVACSASAVPRIAGVERERDCHGVQILIRLSPS
ncbi:MAG: (Fe-S)-binding protein [Roseiflexaceae bacterium]|nr:(Fe-S)-binding protein [Roseiflexaceae bacterium]